MRTIRMALLGSALMAAAPALAQPAPDRGPGPQGDRGPAAMFNQIDANKDGRATWDEAWVFVEQRFRAADPNNDGSLTQQEMATARLRPDGNRSGANRPEGGPPGPQRERMIGFVFRGLDANRDGGVTLEEIRPAAEARFRSFDVNNDGAVTRNEVPNRPRHQRPAPGGPAPAPAQPG